MTNPHPQTPWATEMEPEPKTQPPAGSRKPTKEEMAHAYKIALGMGDVIDGNPAHLWLPAQQMCMHATINHHLANGMPAADLRAALDAIFRALTADI